MSVTMKDIAQRANVSLSAVSQALRNKGTLAPETRKKIITIAEEMGYMIQEPEKQLRLAVVCTDGSMSSSEIYNGFYEGAKNALGDSICLVAVAPSPDAFPISSILVGAERIDGVIFFGGEVDHPILQALLQLDVKCVVINRESSDKRVSTVSLDNHNSFYEATSHLIEHGHTGFAYVHLEPMTSWSRLRLEGCREAVEKNKGQLRVIGLKKYAELENKIRGIAASTTAILAENDLVAIEILNVIRAMGMQVPGDFAIFGCDNLSIGASSKPAISTIDVPAYRIGEIAGVLLRDLVNGDTSYGNLIVPGQLVLKESCGCS